MQKPVIPPFAVATLLIAVLPLPALAQVTTSQSALDALGPSSRKPAAHHQAAAAATHGKNHAPAHATPSRTATAHPAQHVTAWQQKHPGPAPAHAPAATIPAAPPLAPVFTAPVINVPLHPPAPPPPVVVVPNAVGTATPIADGVRISFGAASSDVNPATMQALHDFAARVKAQPGARAILDAAAAGSPDDPSTPRRLALSRGLAARAVLINDGIASTRIYVRMDPDAAAGSAGVDLHLQSNPDANVTPIPGLPPSQSTSQSTSQTVGQTGGQAPAQPGSQTTDTTPPPASPGVAAPAIHTRTVPNPAAAGPTPP